MTSESKPYRQSVIGFARRFVEEARQKADTDDLSTEFVAELVASALVIQLALSDRPIQDPYKLLSETLDKLRAVLVGLEPEELRFAALRRLDRFVVDGHLARYE